MCTLTTKPRNYKNVHFVNLVRDTFDILPKRPIFIIACRCIFFFYNEVMFLWALSNRPRPNQSPPTQVRPCQVLLRQCMEVPTCLPDQVSLSMHVDIITEVKKPHSFTVFTVLQFFLQTCQTKPLRKLHRLNHFTNSSKHVASKTDAIKRTFQVFESNVNLLTM
jgi:hypothetical protein